MTRARYVTGSAVRCTGTYTSVVTGALVDPTTPLFEYRDGAGAVTSVAPTRESQGVYHVDLAANRATAQAQETWTYRFYSAAADPVFAAGEGQFIVYTLGDF